MIKRDSSVLDTYGMRDLYVVTACMTVRKKRVGRFGSSTICCMKAARTSGRNASVILKQMPIAFIQIDMLVCDSQKLHLREPTFNGLLETNLLLREVQQHQQFDRGQQL